MAFISSFPALGIRLTKLRLYKQEDVELWLVG